MIEISIASDSLDIWAKLRELELLGEISLNSEEEKFMDRLYRRLAAASCLDAFSVSQREKTFLMQMWEKYVR